MGGALHVAHQLHLAPDLGTHWGLREARERSVPLTRWLHRVQNLGLSRGSAFSRVSWPPAHFPCSSRFAVSDRGMTGRRPSPRHRLQSNPLRSSKSREK